MTDERADRVRAIAEGAFGRVVESSSDSMTVEVPADLAMGLPWGQARLVPVYQSQRTGMADRRVVDQQGRAVVCPGDKVTQNYYIYRVAL